MNDEHYKFRQWLFKNIEGLKAVFESKDDLATAFLLRDWIGRHATFTHKELLLQHGSLDTKQLLEKLLLCEGGVWCGGTARVFSGIAQALPGFYVAEYSFGYHADGVSHTTNIVGLKNGKCYNLDAYHGYHWVDSESQELLEFGEMLRRIKCKEYNRITRVDIDLPRPALAGPGDNGRGFRWLYGYGEIPQPVCAGGYAVYLNAMPKFEWLYSEGAKNRLRVDSLRGEQPLDEFMLDMIFVEADLSRFAPDASSSFTEYSVMRGLIRHLIRS
jgi:hypothetical protein